MSDYTLIQGDSLEWIATMEAGSADVAIFDPPYGIDGSTGTINKQRAKGEYNSTFEDNPEYICNLVVPVVRMCIEKFGAVIVTPGNRNFSLYPHPDSFGCFYQPAAVGLQTFGNLDAQPIFYYGKNATKKNMGVRCSFQMTSQADDVAHPCRKPTKEWQQLILAHTLPGQTVLDPFMGSGTTGEICIKNDRKFIGVELDVAYFQLAKQRIEKAAQMAAGEFVTKAGSVADTDDLPLFGT